MQSKRRQLLEQDKKQATFDYILANAIGKSMSRLYSSANTMPDIAEFYPTLFDSKEIEEAKQKQIDELSAIRFKQFANSFNKNRGEAKIADG